MSLTILRNSELAVHNVQNKKSDQGIEAARTYLVKRNVESIIQRI